MHKVVIDGKELEVEDGVNVIVAAERVGVQIPHFCYHPSLSVVAQCRQCLVEVKGIPRVMPACNMYVADGMEVFTKSEKAVEARRACSEFTLINHPLDCPVCDKGGECALQMTTVSHGRDYSRFDSPEEKKVRKKYYLGERIIHDPNRCIMCTRCVRFTDEVTKTGELGYDNRGFRKKITVFPGRELNNELSGNVIDLCPVGALLPKDSLHGERVWYTKKTDTVCPLCSNGCNITVGANRREGKIMRVRPRVNEKVNGHWICDRGRFEFGGVQTPEKRLKIPIAKNSAGGYEQISWELAASNFQNAFSSGASAFVCSAVLTNEELYIILKLSEEFGAESLVCSAGEHTGEKKFGLISSDPFPNSAGTRDLGIKTGADEMDKLLSDLIGGKFDSMFVAHEDLSRFTANHTVKEITEALARLSFLAVVDTRLTQTARLATLILPGATPYEKDGTFTNDRGRVQRIRKTLDCPGEALQDWEALLRLGGSKPEQFFHGSPAEIMGEIAARFKPYELMDYDLIDFLGLERKTDVAGQPSV
ncbi:MAG: molybdopterin-dependent oxidoreductase [Candidatus Mycalebacterium zealandia]|nr:MAG: molybdopterin-dependent oxidoreductase [Candidatus Mycalebacterium zealandia]